MLGAMQPLDAFDFDHVGAGAADVRAHLDQHPREVLHLGLARRVFDHGAAARRAPPPS